MFVELAIIATDVPEPEQVQVKEMWEKEFQELVDVMQSLRVFFCLIVIGIVCLGCYLGKHCC